MRRVTEVTSVDLDWKVEEVNFTALHTMARCFIYLVDDAEIVEPDAVLGPQTLTLLHLEIGLEKPVDVVLGGRDW